MSNPDPDLQALDSQTGTRDPVAALAEPRVLVNIEGLAAPLPSLWRMRDAQGHFMFDIPVPPDERTAAAILAAIQEQQHAK